MVLNTFNIPQATVRITLSHRSIVQNVLTLATNMVQFETF